MSASNKKNLRIELNADILTEKQKREQQEAKKLKMYTLTFAVVMVLVVAIVVGVVVSPMIDGVIRRSSNAVTIGEHTLTTNDLTYFYFDAINEYQQNVYNSYYSSFGNYWTVMLGFDTAKPLNEQKYEGDENRTWADYFMDTALDTAKDIYALCDDANANGHSLTEDEQKSVDSYLSSLSSYASYYGYSSVKSYLRSTYGNGATEESYSEYYKVCALASSYLSKHSDELEYDPSDYRAYEKDKFENYSSFSYIYYTLRYNSYLGEGTKGEDGNTTWTDEEKDAARTAMKADMATLLAAGIKDKETFDKAVQSLAINKTEDEDDTKATATEITDQFYKGITLSEDVANWLKEEGRTSGDLKEFPVYTYAEHEDPEHEHGDDCGCSRTVDRMYLVLFNERNDNEVHLANVRHILVKFTGGKTDSNGNTTYSDAEKAKAKEEAEKLLQQWTAGDATEDSFAELANKESDDNNGKVTNGGLYEDIYPGKMVENFDKWCFDSTRKAGDTGIVETEYGYHVMYYSSTDSMTYRDLMIDSDLRSEDTQKWQDDLAEKISCDIIDLSKMDYDHVIAG